MTGASTPHASSLSEKILRFVYLAMALTLVVAISASVGSVREPAPDARAHAMVEQGRMALAEGDANGAIDAFEAALAIDPAYTQIFVELGTVARGQGLPGKAISHYRTVLSRDPYNFAAISGEGEALAEQGAIAQAQRNLARLESLCGVGCAETRALQASIRMQQQTRVAAGKNERNRH